MISFRVSHVVFIVLNSVAIFLRLVRVTVRIIEQLFLPLLPWIVGSTA